MDRAQLVDTFDQQAATYDEKWARLSPFRDSLHLLVASIFSALPADARLLCVGAGTGAEILFLAGRFPGWTFTAVEPSAGMVEAFRRRAEAAGIAGRCRFHTGYLESLPASGPFDAATCFLVSQFILDIEARQTFFRGIAQRLRPGGLLASSDLSADVEAPTYGPLLDAWLKTIGGIDVTPEAMARMREAYERDVAVLPPSSVEGLLQAAGFASPVLFHQAGLIRAWSSRRSS